MTTAEFETLPLANIDDIITLEQVKEMITGMFNKYRTNKISWAEFNKELNALYFLKYELENRAAWEKFEDTSSNPI